MICKLSFQSWGRWEQLTPEEYAELREAIPELPETYVKYPPDVITNLSAAQPVLAKLGLEATLKPYSSSLALVTLKDRIVKLEAEHQLSKAELALNGTVVQVHVPNIGLLAFNEVQVLDDICTDSLQDELDKGWRIMAVCPPMLNAGLTTY